MDQNLIGYLLNALDDDTRLRVERVLASDAAARERLELLRRALEPLAADAEVPEPPGDLVARTLAHIDRTRAAAAILRLPERPTGATRVWWRRADVLVAATILLGLVSLIPSGLVSLQHARDRIQCQDNLRAFHQALMRYCDTHGDNLPKVEAAPPAN